MPQSTNPPARAVAPSSTVPQKRKSHDTAATPESGPAEAAAPSDSSLSEAQQERYMTVDGYLNSPELVDYKMLTFDANSQRSYGIGDWIWIKGADGADWTGKIVSIKGIAGIAFLEVLYCYKSIQEMIDDGCAKDTLPDPADFESPEWAMSTGFTSIVNSGQLLTSDEEDLDPIVHAFDERLAVQNEIKLDRDNFYRSHVKFTNETVRGKSKQGRKGRKSVQRVCRFEYDAPTACTCGRRYRPFPLGEDIMVHCAQEGCENFYHPTCLPTQQVARTPAIRAEALKTGLQLLENYFVEMKVKTDEENDLRVKAGKPPAPYPDILRPFEASDPVVDVDAGAQDPSLIVVDPNDHDMPRMILRVAGDPILRGTILHGVVGGGLEVLLARKIVVDLRRLGQEQSGTASAPIPGARPVTPIAGGRSASGSSAKRSAGGASSAAAAVAAAAAASSSQVKRADAAWWWSPPPLPAKPTKQQVARYEQVRSVRWLILEWVSRFTDDLSKQQDLPPDDRAWTCPKCNHAM